MLVQFNSDKNIEGTEALALRSEETIRSALAHFSGQITRIEMHVSDENSSKKVGDDAIRCRIEARLSGRQPIAVSHSASTVAMSVDGAADKMKRAIEALVGRRDAVARKRNTAHVDAVADRQQSLAQQQASESRVTHADGATRRPESPTLEGRVPLPEEITGRASGTDEDLAELFDNPTGAHLTDGFRGGSDDESVREEPGISKPRPSSDEVDRAARDRG